MRVNLHRLDYHTLALDSVVIVVVSWWISIWSKKLLILVVQLPKDIVGVSILEFR
jgi:hypothetical protein